MSNTVKIGEIASLKTGPFGTQFSAKEYTNSGIPVINVKNIGYGQIIEDELEYVSEQTRDRLCEHILHTGDIVFGRKGSVDRHAYISEKYDGWVQGSDCIRLRFRSGINTRYVSHFFKLNHIRKQINCSSVGSTMASLNTDILRSIEILLPPVEIQNDAEKVLSAIEEKMELNSVICTELEVMAKTLYDYWFTQFDFPNAEGKPYRSSGGEMVWNDQLKRDIPKGWKVVPITDGYDVCYGFPFDTNYFVDDNSAQPVVRIRDILDRSISAYTTEKVDKRYWLQSGDMIIGMDGNFHINFWDNTRALLNQRCVRVRSTGKLPVFMAYFASLPYIKAREKNVSRTTVGHLSAGDIKSLYVFLPDETTLNSSKAIFNVAIEKICRANDENRELKKLRDWLLPMLMNGQATVE